MTVGNGRLTPSFGTSTVLATGGPPRHRRRRGTLRPAFPLPRPLALVLGVVAALVVGLALFGSRSGSQLAAASGGGPEMSLSVPAGATSCGGGSCDVDSGVPFTLAVSVVAGPAAGYVLVQTYIDYGVFDPTASEDSAGANTCSDSMDNGDGDGEDRFDSDCATANLAYKPAAQLSDEIVWPDLGTEPPTPPIVMTEDGVGLLGFGGLTGLTPPLPISTFVGSVVEVQLTCASGGVQTVIDLLPYNDPIAKTKGALFLEQDGTKVVPKVDSLTINCVEADKLPEPGDTDGDGCSDQRENGPDETLGGQRSFINPYDFYDVLGGGGGPPDQIIDLTNDIFGVIQHYAPTGTEPEYDVDFDRGPTSGPNVWNMTAPDGVIDLTNDILGVIQQYLHSCQ